MGEDKNYARRVENRSREGISVFLTIYLPFSDEFLVVECRVSTRLCKNIIQRNVLFLCRQNKPHHETHRHYLRNSSFSPAGHNSQYILSLIHI